LNFIEAKDALRESIAVLRPDLNFYKNSLPKEFTSPYIIIEEVDSLTINTTNRSVCNTGTQSSQLQARPFYELD